MKTWQVWKINIIKRTKEIILLPCKKANWLGDICGENTVKNRFSTKLRSSQKFSKKKNPHVLEYMFYICTNLQYQTQSHLLNTKKRQILAETVKHYLKFWTLFQQEFELFKQEFVFFFYLANAIKFDLEISHRCRTYPPLYVVMFWQFPETSKFGENTKKNHYIHIFTQYAPNWDRSKD